MFDDEVNDKPDYKPHCKRLGRELAMQYLFRCDMRNELPSDTTFDQFFDEVQEQHALRQNRLARKGREYALHLCNSVKVHYPELDKVIQDKTENWAWQRLSRVDRNIMRIAVAEMLYENDVPPIVSIDEAVEIARDYSGEVAGNFINGVLNGIKNTLPRSNTTKPGKEK